MPTYIYETLPRAGAKPRRFELHQSMKEPALTEDPATGEKVRRIITGGGELFVREATVERPQPRPPKKSRFRKEVRREDGRPAHFDHGHDHDH